MKILTEDFKCGIITIATQVNILYPKVYGFYAQKRMLYFCVLFWITNLLVSKQRELCVFRCVALCRALFTFRRGEGK